MGSLSDYLKAAVLHPWNLILVGGATVGSVVLGSEVPLLLAGGAELMYLGVVPSSARFRRAIDARLAGRRRKLEDKRLADLTQQLAANQREHYLSLRALADKIEQNHHRIADTHGSVLLEQTRARISALLDSFLRLLLTLNDYRRYLSETDRRRIESDLSELKPLDGESEAVKQIKEKRAQILKARLTKFTQAEEHREVIAHQLASIEDMLRLVHEQSITIRDPAAITSQLDALTAEVESTESTVREMQGFLELQSEAQVIAPGPTRVR